jgi:acyl dehydratase
VDSAVASSSSTTTREVLALGGGDGAAYARLTGDWNPIHVWPWAARALGLRGAVAHGMCVVEKALPALLEQAAATVATTATTAPAVRAAVAAGAWPGPAKLTISFRRPVPLPSQVALVCRARATARGGAVVGFGVEAVSAGKEGGWYEGELEVAGLGQ